MLLNLTYFGSTLVGAILAQSGVLGYCMWPFLNETFSLKEGTFLFVVVNIFVFNLFLSAFVMITLPGLVFFVVPIVFLVFRAIMWGFFLQQLPTSQFLVVFPVIVLEGEGYVVAAVAGIVLGLSYLKPSWVYRGEEELSRLGAFKIALKESAYLYVLVMLFLFLAAVVETLIILYL